MYQISAWLRVLVKTSVVAAASISATTRGKHGDAEMAAPGKALGLARQQRVDDQRLVELAAHDERRSASGAEKRALRHFEIAERRREAPDQRVRAPAAEARERKLRLHAALVAEKLVPFVDDDHVERGEARARARGGRA